MLSHTALLHPSQMGITCAVPSRELTGTDILLWASVHPHMGYVPGKWVGGWPLETLAR